MRTETFVAIAMVILLLPSVCLASDAGAMDDFWDKVNYSLGHQIGTDLKGQGAEINEEALATGIADALSEAPPRVNPEEMQTLLRQLKQKLVADQQQKEFERRKEAYRKEGKVFLEANAKKEGVVALPSGLQYKVLTEGKGRKPGPADTVTVHYRGTFIDGTEFDSSYERKEPTKFQVDGVIEGWTEALQLMKEGAKWQVFVPSDLAYRERGPLAGRTLLFDIELISVE